MHDPNEITQLKELWQYFSKHAIHQSTLLTTYEAVAAYCAITGACIEGAKAYADQLIASGVISKHSIHTLTEIQALTKHQAYSERFTQALNASDTLVTPYASPWDQEINTPQHMNGITAQSYWILQHKSEASFNHCSFTQLHYTIDTATTTLIDTCNGSIMNLTIGACKTLTVRDSTFTTQFSCNINSGENADIAITTQYADITITTCRRFALTLNNYSHNTPDNAALPILGINMNVTHANPTHTHELKLPLHKANGEQLYYCITGSTARIHESLRQHIVNNEAHAIPITLKLHPESCLELSAR